MDTGTQAQAQLEKARGESAALRNLANSARLFDNNPNLMQLRIIGAISESQQNTFVISLGDGTGLPPQVSTKAK